MDSKVSFKYHRMITDTEPFSFISINVGWLVGWLVVV